MPREDEKYTMNAKRRYEIRGQCQDKMRNTRSMPRQDMKYAVNVKTRYEISGQCQDKKDNPMETTIYS